VVERRRIDIAILFMFQDMLRMQTGVSFNLNMYDELLDSAVDLRKELEKYWKFSRGKSGEI
jgi:hypothetical protein